MTIMHRTLRLFLPLLLLALTVPAFASATSVCEAGVMEFFQNAEISIVYSQGQLSVYGAEGCRLEVISLTGKKLFEESVSSPSQKFELSIPKGCYIVKVGDVVRKISVR